MTFPHIIRYTDKMPDHVGGYARWFYIAIRPKYKDDLGIHAHEKEHVRQWWVLTIVCCALIAGACHILGQPYHYAALGAAVHSLLYKFVRPYRQWAEVEAFKEQLKHYEPHYLPNMARRLSRGYGLKITQEEAERLLQAKAIF
jgi:Flp pilus assembly protein TadB